MGTEGCSSRDKITKQNKKPNRGRSHQPRNAFDSLNPYRGEKGAFVRVRRRSVSHVCDIRSTAPSHSSTGLSRTIVIIPGVYDNPRQFKINATYRTSRIVDKKRLEEGVPLDVNLACIVYAATVISTVVLRERESALSQDTARRLLSGCCCIS